MKTIVEILQQNNETLRALIEGETLSAEAISYMKAQIHVNQVRIEKIQQGW